MSVVMKSLYRLAKNSINGLNVGRRHSTPVVQLGRNNCVGCATGKCHCHRCSFQLPQTTTTTRRVA